MKTIQELKEIVQTGLHGQDSNELLKALEELERYKQLEEQEKLVEFPCKVGDYVEFSGGNILPVVSLTKSSNGDISVCCQNGHIVNVRLQYPGWAKRFIPKEEYRK
ncbi:hypothetical protein CVD28_00470 [Bacillus sp. M6-12]|uniref:hypothetical protein n=1 Tax=Bacillus sp. M6-12 TaxID=2054166 RepID=UPI000C78DDB0|nr:hypothetical protein [Bacillus sp. M6-12]PLS18908.1 hypothetical protein CVD28_00470 [Bacillus sp. M6-12]